MLIPIKKYYRSILEESMKMNLNSNTSFTATKQQNMNEPYKTTSSQNKGIPPENNGTLQKVLYDSRQPMKSKTEKIVKNYMQDKLERDKMKLKSDTEIQKAQILSQK